ncbi:MAG: Gfo/Idh/MocA family oxidoreductase [Bacteroidota bacterium]
MKRRTFLQKSSKAALALALPQGNCRSGKRQLGVALVGLGYYSTDLLAPALQLTRHCKLTGIVTGSPHKIPVWQKRYGIKDQNVYSYETMSRIADNPDIDVIYIVLPTGLHAKYAIMAANTGKAVWCEKPMARTAKECQAIIKACQQNKVPLSIGYRMQHEPNTRRIMELAKSRPYGQLISVKAEAGYFDGRSNDHWKLKKAMGGGAMYDMGVYPVNAMRYATGLEPIAVRSAVQSTQRPQIFTEVDETTEFLLEFPEGILTHGKTSFGKGLNELQVDCKEGWYRLSPFQSYSGVRGRASDGTQFPADPNNQQARQMDNDALAIMEQRPVLVPGEEGMKDIRIVEAVYETARTGRAVDLRE